ncbi:MAG: HAMP domain-containing histidine kinase [Rhodospirillaceae bacterium]|jgi:signal transduction histidine kinase|nr:HAMP domain-containing histidine kinase [Rhodospirillaceae bacterium]MBT5667286.1 HAMP domain-containing histidine kinase [Rhodospirillaceae bacterium]MBT5812192.1 HAMP domain-containing histidine kinase [Rhodospirillaceae bacterium]
MRSLSSQLLILTIVFVMLAEVFIFVPSVARFRLAWLNERLSAAHLAILTLDEATDGMVSDNLREELLGHVGAYAINIRRGGAKLVLAADMPPPVQATVDLTESGLPKLVGDALMTLERTDARVLRVVGPSPKSPEVIMDIIIEEQPLKAALVDFAWRIFWLSIVISLVTATLVFLSLQWLMVRPMRRITQNMTDFREDPEDAQRIIPPSARQDEIGVAQRELANLQTGLRAALRQKEHLAALGVAVAKINHDLRGILSTAVLVSDRLEGSEDPEVRRVTPALIAAIDQAVTLCEDTLGYVRQDDAAPRIERMSLFTLVAEIADNAALTNKDGFHIDNQIDQGLDIDADRSQIHRVLNNLTKNAMEADAMTVTISAHSEPGFLHIDINDDGPGLPSRARDNLFLPFRGSVRAGGTGLGLANARELMRNHGGDLTLIDTGESGSTFRATLPVS